MTRALLAAALLTAPALAQEDARLRGQSDQTYKRLVEAERKLTAGKPGDAAEDLQRILDEAGDDLVLAPPAENAYRPARQVAQRIFAQLPPEALRGYRDRTEGPARRLLDAGVKGRDPRPLKTLIDRYFASRPAEDALLLLGELAFERGEFRAAEGYWRRLLPEDANADPSYPGPRTDAAAVRARVALALIFQADLPLAKAEVARLRTESPMAAGRLAGRDGPFVDTLQALLDRPPMLAAETAGDGEWTSFAGSPGHDGRVSGRLPYYWPTRPTWTVPIPSDDPRQRVSVPRRAPTRAVGFHPVVLNGVVYIADAVRVFGFDLLTGASRFSYDLRGELAAARVADVKVALPLTTDSDFTLSTGGGRLFARLGVPAMAAPAPTAAGRAGLAVSFLVGFAPPDRPAADGSPLEVAWKLPPPTTDGAAATWEGAPVWSDGRLFAAVARFDQTRTIHAIACYDDPPGKPLWVTDVADGPPPKADDPSYRQELLTLAGDNLVFCTHTGVTAAVDIRSGKLAWGLRYPKAARPPANPWVRDLSPPLYYEGRVFVAPADADRVLALDAATGRPLWQFGPIQVEQMLGVTRGRLVCTIAQPSRGIRALSVATGSDREPDGWAVHDDPQLGSFGRGFVSEGAVVWPTKAALFLLNPSNGTLLRPPVRGAYGNLAFADGVMLVATPTQLWGFVADRKEVAVREAAVRQRPDDTERQRRLALALADAGKWGDAEVLLRRADPVDAGRLHAEWLTDRAERALALGQLDDARAWLRRMSGDEFPSSWRARAVARLAELESGGGGRASREAFVKALALPGELGPESVLQSNGPPTELREVLARRFGELTPPPASDWTPHDPPARERHRLGANAAVATETQFRSNRFGPLSRFADREGLPTVAGPDGLLFVSDGSTVLAYQPGDAKPVWESRLPSGLFVTSAEAVGSLLLVVGTNGVAAIAEGRVVWSFRVPEADPLPGTVSSIRGAAPPIIPELTGFTLAGKLLVARLGEHHLIAFDLRNGTVAWVVDSFGRPRYTPLARGPCFDPHFLADEGGIVARLSNGRRITISPRGVAAEGPATSVLDWSSPPVALGRGLAALADGPTLVHGIRRGDGGIAWTHDSGREASATGQPPGLKAIPGSLIVAFSRNHGAELDRLRAESGTREWETRPPTLLPTGRVDLAAADADEDYLYVPGEGRLFAVRLADGAVVWEVITGPGRWRAVAGRNTVVAMPMEAMPAEPPAASLAAFGRAPIVVRLPGLAAAAYDAWATRTLPVLVLDRATGAPRRRLTIPAVGPTVGAHFGETAVVVTAGRAYWLK